MLISSLLLSSFAATTLSAAVPISPRQLPNAVSCVTSATDTVSNFLQNLVFSSSALLAITPVNYTVAFRNYGASCNAINYLGYLLLPSYNTTTCATICNSKQGCNAFNLYYERDPTQDPVTGCWNPASTVSIKCVLWGAALTANQAVNIGEQRGQFHVAIAGSNGYNHV